MRWNFFKKLYRMYAEPIAHSRAYGVLIDSNTKAVLVVGENIPALVFLSECTPETSYSPWVNRPNYEGYFFLLDEPAHNYPRWVWDVKKRLFLKKEEYLHDVRLKDVSFLAIKKYKTVSLVMGEINESRRKIGTGTFFQELIYVNKKLQAEKFIELGCDDMSIFDYPYVLQYADHRGFSFKEAAEDILLKGKLADEHLSKTEFLRLKYFDLIRKASSIHELESLESDFMRDCYINAKM